MNTTTAAPEAERDTRLRLAVDGPLQRRTGPFRHQNSPRVRRLADELGVDLAGITGSGPDGRARPQDIRRAASTGASRGGEARLAVDGPRRPRVGPFRHAHSPRVRRLATELDVDLDQVDGTGASGRVQPADVRDAAAPADDERRLQASTARSSHDTQQEASTHDTRPAAAGAPAATDGWITVQLDLGPLLAAWRRIAAGPPPEGAELTPFLVFAHALLATLPGVAEAIGGRGLPGEPLTAQVEVAGAGAFASITNGHDLTITGLLRRIAEQPPAAAENATRLAVHNGAVRGAMQEVPVRTGQQVLAVSLGATREEPVISRDELGHQVTTVRPVADLTLRYDSRSIASDAVSHLVEVLRCRLGELHRALPN